jgi:hypothetical protein
MKSFKLLTLAAATALCAAVIVPHAANAEGGSTGGSIGKREKSASGGHEVEAPKKTRVIDRLRRPRARSEARRANRRPSQSQPVLGQPVQFPRGADGFRRDPIFGVRMPEAGLGLPR